MSELQAASPERSTSDLPAPALSGRGQGLWAGIRAAIGAVLGLLPHLMHHIGLLAGAAVLTGAVGNSVLYVVGLVLSIPLLRRLHRRFGTWRAPALGAGVFTGLFLLSALVLGPAISGSGADPASDSVPLPVVTVNPRSDLPSSTADPHSGHH